jgi:hypothetical protein
MPVDEKHETYRYYESEWRVCRDCVKGQKAVKDAKTLYLPMLGGRSKDVLGRYEKYLKRALFFNATRRTLEALTGFLFRKPPVFAPDDSELLDTFTNNPGGFSAFVQEMATELLEVGRFVILIDAPVDGGDPRLIWYRTEDLINWEADGSRYVLREFHYLADPEDEFKTTKTVRYRVLDVFDGRYRQRLYAEVEEDEYAVVSEIFPMANGQPLTEIPLVIINSVDLLPEPSEPPLIDLADVNLSHYRSSADLESGRYFTGFPTPWAVGFDVQGDVLEIGGAAWVTDNPDAKFGFLEFTGQGLGSLENALKDKEAMMAVLGARILEAQKRAVEAADTHRLRYAGEQSVLAKAAWNFDAGVSAAVRICAAWRKLPDAESFGVSLNKDYASTHADSALVTALFAALQGSAISEDTWFYNLKRWELIPETRTLDEEMELIAARRPDMG